MSLRVIPKSEIATHCKRGDCWIIVHKHVFDVSRWMENHPGGWEILFDYSKKCEDAAEEFEAIKHTDDARKEALKYLIGKVEESIAPFPMKSQGKLKELGQPVTPTNIVEGGEMYPIYGAIAVAIAVGGYFFLKRRAQ